MKCRDTCLHLPIIYSNGFEIWICSTKFRRDLIPLLQKDLNHIWGRVQWKPSVSISWLFHNSNWSKGLTEAVCSNPLIFFCIFLFKETFYCLKKAQWTKWSACLNYEAYFYRLPSVGSPKSFCLSWCFVLDAFSFVFQGHLMFQYFRKKAYQDQILSWTNTFIYFSNTTQRHQYYLANLKFVYSFFLWIYEHRLKHRILHGAKPLSQRDLHGCSCNI